MYRVINNLFSVKDIRYIKKKKKFTFYDINGRLNISSSTSIFQLNHTSKIFFGNGNNCPEQCEKLRKNMYENKKNYDFYLPYQKIVENFKLKFTISSVIFILKLCYRPTNLNYATVTVSF